MPNFGEYWEVALKVTKAIRSSLKPEWVNYFTHGLQVEHAHIHILPRYSTEESEIIPDKVLSIEDGEMTAIKHLIKAEIK